MDIRALRYFVELVEQQSFTRASERLFVTQPTISKMVRNLEEELALPLLQREGHKLHMTDYGQVVYQRAKAMLAEMNQLKAELQDLQNLQGGHLRIGIPPMVGQVYASLIRHYRQRYPLVEISIVEFGGRQIEQELEQGALDLAITMLPTRHNESFETLELAVHPILAVLPNEPRWQPQKDIHPEAEKTQEDTHLATEKAEPAGDEPAGDTHHISLTGHPPAEENGKKKLNCDREQAIYLGELKEQPFLLYTQAFTLSERLEQACLECGFTPQIAARSSQWDFLAAMVRSGMGVAFLPEPICRQLGYPPLLFRPMLPAIEWRLGVIWPKGRYLSRSAEAWLELCKELIEQHQQGA